MGVSSTILYGNCIEKNQPVSGTGHHKVVLKGKYKGQKSSFTLDEDILSKHKKKKVNKRKTKIIIMGEKHGILK